MNLFRRRSPSPIILILGAGVRAGNLYREIIEPKPRAQSPILGFVPLEAQDSVIPENLILHCKETLMELTKKMKVSEIVVVQDHPTQKSPVQQLLNCKLAGIQLSDADSFLKRVRNSSNLHENKFGSSLTIFDRFHWR